MAKRPPIDLTGRRHGWPPVGFRFRRPPSDSHLLEMADARQWRLVNLQPYFNVVPKSLRLRGMLTDLLPDHAAIDACRSQGVPVVRIGHDPHPQDSQVPAVVHDRAACGRLAAEHFAERGYKHVAFFRQPRQAVMQALHEAFAARAEELGMTFHLMISGLRSSGPAEEFFAASRQEFVAWIRGIPHPVGLLAGAPLPAMRFCRWALEAGLPVPDQIAVLSVGDQPLFNACALVPISSIVMDASDRLERAFNLMARLMDGETLEESTVRVGPRGVTLRRSTDFLAAGDPTVARALRYMWDHLDRNLSVSQIATEVGVSRRTLENAFRKDLGRGVGAEFRRRRLEKARELLQLKKTPVHEIVEGLHFNSVSSLSRMFRAAYGMSPTQYRQKILPQEAT